MHKHLFVYGSLMGSIQSKIAQMLHDNADFLGEAYVKGHLFDLGSYPGLVLNDDGNTVKGHIFRLYDAQSILSYLDQYEGILPNNPDLNEYARKLIPVNFNDVKIECWAYIYQLPTQSFPIIPFENYLDYLRQQPGHQAFLNQV